MAHPGKRRSRRFIFRRRGSENRSADRCNASTATMTRRRVGNSHRSVRRAATAVDRTWRSWSLSAAPCAFPSRFPPPIAIETPERVRARAPRESTRTHRVRTKPTRHWMRTGNRFVGLPPWNAAQVKGRGAGQPGEPGKPPLLLTQHPT